MGFELGIISFRGNRDDHSPAEDYETESRGNMYYRIVCVTGNEFLYFHCTQCNRDLKQPRRQRRTTTGSNVTSLRKREPRMSSMT